MEGENGIVIEDVCGGDMQNLVRRLVFMLMRAGALVGEAVAEAVGMMAVMVVVVVVMVGIIYFSEKRCLSVTEVKCLGVGFRLVRGDILDLGWSFAAAVVQMEVDNLEFGVGAVVRLVWNCLNGRLYFLWCLS